MRLIESAKSSLDAYQQKHPLLGFPIAVSKRYGSDEAGKQAALITYYGFLALFPLLLVFITIISIAGSGDRELQVRISNQVFQYFPALGSDLQHSVHSIKGSGLALALELLVLFYGARGLAMMLGEAFNHVWHVDAAHRQSFLANNLRSFAMLISVGVGIVLGTLLSYGLNSVLHVGLVASMAAMLLNIVITCGLFLLVFRLGTSDHIKLHWLLPGAILAGLGVLLVQHFGTFIMSQQLPKLRGIYGSFALALGIMFWIYLQAQVIMYALEITAVRAQKDWPKKLF